VEITPGSYPEAEKYPSQALEAPGLSVSGEGRSCNPLNSAFSNFNVADVHYDWYGRPVLFSATLQQRCSISDGSLLASIDHEFGVLGPVAFAEDNVVVVIENRLWEFTTSGQLVKAVPISVSDGTPPSATDPAKDLVVSQDGGLHIGHGVLDDGTVHSLDPTTGLWRHDRFSDWKHLSTAGIARLGDFLFVTEGFSPGGLVRFDTTNDYAGERFADSGTVYNDLAAGLDGLLYALRSSRDDIDIFDPVTLAAAGSITLDRTVTSIAVNAAGEIFGPTSTEVHRFNASGVSQDSIATGEAISDIDISPEGTIALGAFINGVLITTEALATLTSFTPLEETDSGLNSSTWVAFVQTPPDPIFTGSGFETGDTSNWSGAIGEEAGLLEVTAEAARSGDFGLAVTIGGTCPFTNDLVIGPQPTTISGDFDACETIEAAGVEVVAPGATFRAGSLVELGHDFSVGVATSFTAVVNEAFASGVAYVQDDSPAAEKRFHARFDLSLDAAILVEPDVVDHLGAYSSDGTLQFRLSIKRNDTLSENRLVVAVRTNDESFVETAAGEEVLLPAGWNEIELDWKAGAGDGKLFIWINGVFSGGVSGLTNDASQIDVVRWGYLGGSLTSSAGTLRQDNFSSWR
jgi:hypothetical protein